ncbi:MAG TPA: HD domain-containing protein [Terriglobia bacterium]|nr:HD domain-containing protein [Terriglobia bacterium]
MPKKLIRDAVHGDIELGALEIELMDTPEFQRLRGIRQLGTAYLVFPSAVHTRFEHSLGTSWMAHRIVEILRRHSSIHADTERLIRVSALLHDITHIPFGHTLEDERRVLPRHDKDYARVQYFFEDSEVGRILEREGIQREVILALTVGGTLQADIVGGAISADLLDYLRRDTYFCGLAQNYDSRIFESFNVENGRLVMELEKGGVLRRDAMSELVNLLRIRYTLSERVYFHHTKIASGAMISKVVELAIQSGFDVEELRTLRDETLVWVLLNRYAGNPAIVHLLTSLERRELYKPCTVLTVDIGEDRRREIVRRFHENRDEREDVETKLAAAAGLEPHEVIIYCPSFGMSLPEAEVLVRMDGAQLLPLSGSNNEEIRILKEKHKALWKFYVLIARNGFSRRDQVANAASVLLGTH